MRRGLSKSMSKLTLKGNLSTVEEDPSTLTKKNLAKLSKQRLLSKYSEREDSEFMDDFNDGEDVKGDGDFSLKLNQRTSKVYKSESLSSISSVKTPSEYSETSETDHSDYNDDFLDAGEVNLMQSFQKHNERQKKLAAKEIENKRLHPSSYTSTLETRAPIIAARTHSTNYNEDFNHIEDDRLLKLKIMNRKKSLPVIKPVAASYSPVKKLKRFSSTIDFTSNNASQRVQRSYSNELDQIEDLDTEDLTITYSDYQKLKRKSLRRIDLSKYKEEPSSTHKKPLHKKNLNNNKSAYDRLKREGKLKVITVMTKPSSKKVVPGHLYGEITYDPNQMKWVGNEDELYKFDTIKKKPQLIKPNSNSNAQIIGDMVYDEKKLRWVSLSGKYDDDPFDDDTTIEKLQPTLPLPKQRIVPSSSTMSLSKNLENYHFKVTSDMYKHWKHEENRWVRKVGNWFSDDSFNNDIIDIRYEFKDFLNKQ